MWRFSKFVTSFFWSYCCFCNCYWKVTKSAFYQASLIESCLNFNLCINIDKLHKTMVADLCHSCFRLVTTRSEKSRINKLKLRERGVKTSLLTRASGTFQYMKLRDLRNQTAGCRAKTCYFAGARSENTPISGGGRQSVIYLTSLCALSLTCVFPLNAPTILTC
jgi:hypothetical protein